MSLKFLDQSLGKLLQPPKDPYGIEADRRRQNNKYYARSKRLMKKHNITMTRDLSYWDFSDPVGTCGLNQGVECWGTAYDWLCARLFELGLEPVDYAKEEELAWQKSLAEKKG